MIRRLVVMRASSVRGDVRVAYHVAPFRELPRDVAAELASADGDDFSRIRGEALVDIRRLEYGRDLTMKTVQQSRRRSRGRDEAVPVVRIITAHHFADRGQIGDRCR